jgi:hypothetical protein
MHGQFAEDPKVFPFARARNAPPLATTVAKRLAWRRSFQINAGPPKIGWRSWNQNSPLIRSHPSELSRGSSVSIRRLKTVLQQSDSRRPTRRNDPKIKDVRAEKDWLSALPPMCRRDARPSAANVTHCKASICHVQHGAVNPRIVDRLFRVSAVRCGRQARIRPNGSLRAQVPSADVGRCRGHSLYGFVWPPSSFKRGRYCSEPKYVARLPLFLLMLVWASGLGPYRPIDLREVEKSKPATRRLSSRTAYKDLVPTCAKTCAHQIFEDRSRHQKRRPRKVALTRLRRNGWQSLSRRIAGSVRPKRAGGALTRSSVQAAIKRSKVPGDKVANSYDSQSPSNAARSEQKS